MAFGDNDGAIGYLLGEENRGLACMFTMMNEARLKVGLQALGTAHGSFQKALAYAREREQGGAPIIEHPDVKRMLMSMKALTEAGRAFAYTEAHVMDRLHDCAPGDDATLRARIDLMIPVIKAWLTEVGQELTSLGVQVHGGMGYVEETGAAQYLRDVRITTIYEGTTGIQAADLLSRKLGRDGGEAMHELLLQVGSTVEELVSASDGSLTAMVRPLATALADLQASTEIQLQALAEAPAAALGNSYDYLMQAGYLLGGWHLARSALVARQRLDAGSDNPFYASKIATALFYSERILPRCSAHAAAVAGPVGSLEAIPVGWI
jgi:hypothetical protein